MAGESQTAAPYSLEHRHVVLVIARGWDHQQAGLFPDLAAGDGRDADDRLARADPGGRRRLSVSAGALVDELEAEAALDAEVALGDARIER
jgi:hypothetical protein